MAKQEVNAFPTKEFFIHMITRDIKLERAIIDLIDNCIDGAKRLKGDDSFDGLEVDLTVNKNEFIIKDNCGGFSLDTAIKYAFRFGRLGTDNREETKKSVGRFGIGMKRALFKLGNKFEVESNDSNDHFQVNVDANKWLQDPDKWNFEYETIDQTTDDLGDVVGTFIRVTELQEDVALEFNSDSFLSSLKVEIEKALNFNLENKIQIKLNGIECKKKGIELLEFDQLKPYYKKIEFENGTKVEAKIFAGLGEPSPDKGGWYIYCNDRLVLESDKTNQTGWEGRRFGESSVRKYHNYFAMFRGVVFFDSDDSRKLPMTTTKTGIDTNSKIYQATKQYMIDSMQEVITFLNDVATKHDDPDIYRKDLVENSDKVDVIQLKSREYDENFTFPEIGELDKPDNPYTTISYWAHKDLVKALKKTLGVSTNREVGERTLEYYVDMEDIKKNL